MSERTANINSPLLTFNLLGVTDTANTRHGKTASLRTVGNRRRPSLLISPQCGVKLGSRCGASVATVPVDSCGRLPVWCIIQQKKSEDGLPHIQPHLYIHTTISHTHTHTRQRCWNPSSSPSSSQVWDDFSGLWFRVWFTEVSSESLRHGNKVESSQVFKSMAKS